MLLQFNFKNYKSFRDSASLDLTASPISEFKDSLITAGSEKVLPVAAILGANASGKSNVLDAFRFMRLYVRQSYSFNGDATDESHAATPPSPSFLFDRKSTDDESSFEVYYTDPNDEKGRVYQYGFTLNHGIILEEWLNYRAKSARSQFNSIFYRNTGENELDMSGLPSSSHQNITTALQKEVLLVSLGKLLNIEILKLVHSWFSQNMIVDFGNPASNFTYSKQMPSGFGVKKELQEHVVKYLASFDPSIVGFRTEAIPHEDGKPDSYKIYSLHKMADTDETAELILASESAGTQKMFALYSKLQYALNSGGVLMIDELNSRLHPLLVRNFIITFLNPETNPKHAQLIFTTHDSWLLESNLLRRDEIWFTEKDEVGASTLYALSEFQDEDGDKIRKDASFGRNYLLGKYGAIPKLGPISILEGQSDGEG